MRGAGIAAVVGGIYLAFDAYDDDRALVPGVALAGGGLAAFTVGISWDLFDAHRAARRANLRARGSASSLTVSPVPSGAVLTLHGDF